MKLPPKPLSPDAAELQLLEECIKLGGMIALAMGAIPNTALQLAHERLIKNEWFRLADLAIVRNPGTRTDEPARIFMITAAGRKRRMDLLGSAKE